MAWRDRLTELREAIEERTGYTVENRERLDILESRSEELGATRRELDALAWTALNYVGGSPQELQAVERRKLTQKARIVWMKDPQAGAAVDLMNDFVFGRGIPKPKANDPEVQKVIDEAWDDPDNQLVLTSYQSQLALGTDLSLQSNLFVLVFADGEDGKVKLGLLDHDAVENVVRDPENRLRAMWYVARHFKTEWDFDLDAPAPLNNGGQADARRGDKGRGEIRYYEHWRNVEDALDDEENGVREPVKQPPKAKLGDGKVFHIAINRTSEMVFGHPTMDRLLRWFTAYNSFIDARLDIIQAKAAFVMKRKIKGTPNQLQKMAQQAVSRRSALGASVDPDLAAGPRPGSILNENENVTHEDLSLDTGAASAIQDSQMIRAQTSAATRFPQSYYGDPSNSNLATATSLELPVLKAVEARQEFFESLVRFFVDKVIERAVEAGRLDPNVTPEQADAGQTDDTTANAAAGPGSPPGGGLFLSQAHEDAVEDEEQTKRDLGYEFKMPNPLKRMLGDVVTAVMNIARTFDPNNTNPELSRVLLIVALTELEVEDPAGMVEKIFPPGYVDPAVAMAQQQMVLGQEPPEQGGGQSPFGEFAPEGPDGQKHPDPSNPYGAPMRSQPPEVAMRQAELRDRNGDLIEGRRRPEAIQKALERRRRELEAEFPGIAGLLDEATGNHKSNGNGNGR